MSVGMDIHELGKFRSEEQIDIAHGTVTLLADADGGQVRLAGLSLFVRARLKIAVNEDDHIGILFNGS